MNRSQPTTATPEQVQQAVREALRSMGIAVDVQVSIVAQKPEITVNDQIHPGPQPVQPKPVVWGPVPQYCVRRDRSTQEVWFNDFRHMQIWIIAGIDAGIFTFRDLMLYVKGNIEGYVPTQSEADCTFRIYRPGTIRQIAVKSKLHELILDPVDPIGSTTIHSAFIDFYTSPLFPGCLVLNPRTIEQVSPSISPAKQLHGTRFKVVGFQGFETDATIKAVRSVDGNVPVSLLMSGIDEPRVRSFLRACQIREIVDTCPDYRKFLPKSLKTYNRSVYVSSEPVAPEVIQSILERPAGYAIRESNWKKIGGWHPYGSYIVSTSEPHNYDGTMKISWKKVV